LFSRAFVRRRVISLATTLSVTATSFALAQDPKIVAQQQQEFSILRSGPAANSAADAEQ
jgi:hypothetical protein